MNSRPLKFGLLTLLSAALLNACTYTYLPPLREARVPEAQVALARGSALKQRGHRLLLVLQVDNVPQTGWLAVQFFNPENTSIYETSRWLRPRAKVQRLEVALPPRYGVTAGRWRTVVSFKGALLRQYSLEATATVETERR